MSYTQSEVRAFVVLVEGKADFDKSVAAYAEALRLHLDHETNGAARMATAINAVFDANKNRKGGSMSTDYVVSEALRLINPEQDMWAQTKKDLTAFIKANHQGKRLPDGSVERPNSLFISNKGKAKGGGTLGLQRRSDLTPAEVELAEAGSTE